MKSRYSKTNISKDTMRKINEIKNLKEELKRTKNNPEAFNFTKEKTIKFLDSISMKEMEVIGAYFGNSLPNFKEFSDGAKTN